MSQLHLTVIQDNAEPNKEPTQVSRLWPSKLYEFIWNNNFTAFKPIRLKWWDDLSYIKYQSD